MRKAFISGLIIATAFSATACKSNVKFDGERTGNDSEFILEYEMFNGSDSQDLKLKEGDYLEVDVVNDGGTLNMDIVKKDDGSEFILEYEMFNGSDSQDLKLKEGDYLEVDVVNDGGTLNMDIVKKDDGEPLYEGENLRTSSFEIKAPEDGIYEVSVEGEKAVGEVTVERIKREEETVSDERRRRKSCRRSNGRKNKTRRRNCFRWLCCI